MGRAKRPLAPALRVKALGAGGGDHGGLERLRRCEGWQDSRQAVREHALAGAGRSYKEEAVGAGGGDLESTPGLALAPDVGEVRIRNVGELGHRPLALRQRAVPGEMADDLREVRGRDDLRLPNALSFRDIAARQDDGMLLERRLAEGGQD